MKPARHFIFQDNLWHDPLHYICLSSVTVQTLIWLAFKHKNLHRFAQSNRGKGQMLSTSLRFLPAQSLTTGEICQHTAGFTCGMSNKVMACFHILLYLIKKIFSEICNRRILRPEGILPKWWKNDWMIRFALQCPKC